MVPSRLYFKDSLAVKWEMLSTAFYREPFIQINPSGYVYGCFPSSISFGMQAVGTNSRDGKAELGTSESQAGFTGRIQRAWLAYDTKHVEIAAGRDAIQLGPGRFSQLLLDVNLPPYDMFRLRLSSHKFQLYAFTSFLPSVQSEYRPQNYINRYLTGKRISFTSETHGFDVGVGDIMLYTGENRPFNWILSNPFVPLYLVENTDFINRETPEYQGDNQNIILFTDGTFHIVPLHKLYYQVIVDEFQFRPSMRKLMNDQIGYTTGYAGVFQLTRRYNIQLQFEFSRLQSWVYNHPGDHTTYLYLDHPIGNQEGGDVREVHLRGDLWSGYQYAIGFKFDQIEKGQVSLFDKWDPQSTKSGSFPSGVIQYTRRFTLECYYYFSGFRYVRFNVSYQDVQNARHLPGVKSSEFNYRVDLYWWV